MEHRVRPIDSGTASVAGRAFTIAATASDELLENPYEHELAAVDATPAGAVVVLATGGCLDVAVWGELLTTRMLARGGVGVVSDGGIRDVAAIRRLGVPSFAAATTPRDSFGRALITGWGGPVRCAGVDVAQGDLVRGDEDGVVVVPAALASAALTAAEEKLGLEHIVRDALARNRPPSCTIATASLGAQARRMADAAPRLGPPCHGGGGCAAGRFSDAVERGRRRRAATSAIPNASKLFHEYGSALRRASRRRPEAWRSRRDDTGGTFTDLVVLDEEGKIGRKRPSTPKRRRRRSSTPSDAAGIDPARSRR
jgi:regulator of RNase E activity RraA